MVQLSRRSPLHKFAIKAIKTAPPRPSKPIDQVYHGAEGDLVQAYDGSTNRLPGSKPAGLLARLFGRSTAIAHAAETSLLSQEGANVSPVMTRSTYDADQYNWSSFICPYCSATSFIKCAGGHLACDGTVEMRSGRRFHQCFCGNAAFIEGAIKTFEANQSILQVELEAAKPTNHESIEANKKPSAMNILPPRKSKP